MHLVPRARPKALESLGFARNHPTRLEERFAIEPLVRGLEQSCELTRDKMVGVAVLEEAKHLRLGKDAGGVLKSLLGSH